MFEVSEILIIEFCVLKFFKFDFLDGDFSKECFELWLWLFKVSGLIEEELW